MWGKNYSGSESLKEAIERFKLDIMRIRNAEKKAHDDDLQPLRDREARARKYMEDTGVVEATATVWQSIQYYGSWSQRDDFGKYCLPDVAFVAATPRNDSRDGNRESVTIRYDGMELQFSSSRQLSYLPDGGYKNEMEVSADGELVFGFSYFEEPSGYVSPTVLRPGHWLIALIKLSEIARLEHGRQMQRLSAEMQADAVKHLDI